MLPFHAIRLGSLSLLLRLTGFEKPGEMLIRALESEDEDVQVMAGMLLEKAGEKAIPAIVNALEAGVHTPTMLLILGDIGTSGERRRIERYLDSADAEIAESAREALQILGLREA